jgi:hypothetical protein
MVMKIAAFGHLPQKIHQQRRLIPDCLKVLRRILFGRPRALRPSPGGANHQQQSIRDEAA